LYNLADVSAEILDKAIKVAHAHLLKELCDVVYTAVGMAVRCGYDFDAAFLKVHTSNMTKTKVGNLVKKLEGYVEPTLLVEAGYEIN
jgi:predicted HAD superfamily Cof-like phosphohydrolase